MREVTAKDMYEAMCGDPEASMEFIPKDTTDALNTCVALPCTWHMDRFGFLEMLEMSEADWKEAMER